MLRAPRPQSRPLPLAGGRGLGASDWDKLKTTKVAICKTYGQNIVLLALLIFFMSASSACRSQERKSDTELKPVMDNAPPLAQITAAGGGVIIALFPFPEPILMCQDDIGIQIWRFEREKQAWSQLRADLISDPKFAIQGMFLLPDDASLLIYGHKINEDGDSEFSVYLWQDGQEKLVLTDKNRYTILPHLSEFFSTQSYLFASKEGDPFAIFRLDAARCKTGTCEFSPVSELSLKSPLGTQEIIWNLQMWTILMSNGEEVDSGAAPFWLNENQVGYLRPTNQPLHLGGMQSELVIRQVPDQTEPTILLNPDMAKSLLIAAGAGSNLGDIILTNARGLANHPDKVLVSATDTNTPDRAILFVINLQTNQVEVVPGITAPSLHQLEISPEGQFLIIPTPVEMQLYAFGTGELVVYPGRKQGADFDPARRHAFSADGEWLLMPSGSISYIANVNSGEVNEISLAGQTCSFGAWLYKGQ